MKNSRGQALTILIGQIVWILILAGVLVIPILAIVAKEMRILLEWVLR